MAQMLTALPMARQHTEQATIIDDVACASMMISGLLVYEMLVREGMISLLSF